MLARVQIDFSLWRMETNGNAPARQPAVAFWDVRGNVAAVWVRYPRSIPKLLRVDQAMFDSLHEAIHSRPHTACLGSQITTHPARIKEVHTRTRSLPRPTPPQLPAHNPALPAPARTSCFCALPTGGRRGALPLVPSQVSNQSDSLQDLHGRM
jgi:hypothetical protein